MLRAGDLRHRFTVQRDAGTTQDSKGQPVPSWTLQAKRWGSLEALGGREGEAIRQRFAEADYVIRLRHDSATAAITPRMRVIQGVVNTNGDPGTGARVFDILENLDPDGRRHERRLVVTEQNL